MERNQAHFPRMTVLAGAAGICAALHHCLRDGDGAAAVAGLLGNFPRQTARARHVHFRVSGLGGVPDCRADISHPVENRRSGGDILDLRSVFRRGVSVCAASFPRNQEPHAGGNRVVVEKEIPGRAAAEGVP